MGRRQVFKEHARPFKDPRTGGVQELQTRCRPAVRRSCGVDDPLKFDLGKCFGHLPDGGLGVQAQGPTQFDTMPPHQCGASVPPLM